MPKLKEVGIGVVTGPQLERLTISCSHVSTLPSCRTPDHVQGRL